jgi:hypothetical protein
MYDERDLAEVAGWTFRRAVALKAAVMGVIVGLISLAMLAPFGGKADLVGASCEPGGLSVDEAPEMNGPLRATQIAFAKVIDDVAVARGLPGHATLVALMTALQESQLQNLSYGDRDSVGLFQQRPSADWGTVEQIRDPRYAAEAFFGGANPPNPPGLVDIDGWPSMTYTEAAQAVQVSAFPDAYAKHEQTAKDIAAAAGIDLSRPGNPYAGRSTAGPGDTTVSLDVVDNCGGGGLIAGRSVNGVWQPESQSVADPTGTGGMVTLRTAAWVAKARAVLGSPSISCWDAHVWNPTSDHPRGRACDLMVGPDARRSPAVRAAGDRIANWTIQTAGQTGVRYVIWYGQIWKARTGKWEAYNGGGVYNPTDANGGHFNHVHVSLY